MEEIFNLLLMFLESELGAATVETAFDYILWNHVFEDGSQQTGGRRGFREQGHIVAHEDVIKGHMLFRSLLQTHANDEGIAAIAKQYEASGVELPSAQVINAARNKLLKIIHPDHAGFDSKMAADLNAARDMLINSGKRLDYARAVQRDKTTIEGYFKRMGGIDLQKIYAQAEQKTRLRLAGPKESINKASQWLHNLSGTQKVGLAFSGAVAVGLGVYCVTKLVQKWRKGHEEKPKDQSDETLSHAERFSRRATQPDMAASLG